MVPFSKAVSNTRRCTHIEQTNMTKFCCISNLCSSHLILSIIFVISFKVAKKVISILIDPYINVFGIMVWIFCHTYNKKVFTLAQIWTILVFASPRPTKSLMNPLENQNATAVSFLSYSSFNFPIRFLSKKNCHKI